MSRWTGSPRTS